MLGNAQVRGGGMESPTQLVLGSKGLASGLVHWFPWVDSQEALESESGQVEG